MPAPPIILQLIERFAQNRAAYDSPAYNETQVRREFIDPFFKALGWDIDNEKGFAEPWKEVIHEDAIKVGGVTRAPDYCFRLGGRRLFFVEAKKPSVNLKEDPSPAYQLRRYGWTAKMPLSILTDFEEFIVYDTRVRPEATDPPSKARVLCIRFEDYPAKWDEIASIFSPEAIQKGGFDKYVESTTKKRGTAEVDDAFLAEIEEWRVELARNVALRNPELSPRELNVAVQRTVDRIVFLRICEDRGVEEYGRLQALLNGEDTYARLRTLYERADERYNSGLFHFHAEKDRPGAPDELTPRLTIDDKVLKSIIKRLYYPDSPYEFSVMPAEILGQVYERFLGSVIRLTAGHQAKVEEKPEVRKAGGVYYTPTFIVDYIVENTVGALLEGKTPQEVAGATPAWKPAKGKRPLAVLDPACGSGSFLLGAYQYLLNWHLEQYAREPEAWSKGGRPRLFQDRRGEWRLTTSERKRILLNHIYGVDIDEQAVEVTKLSLLLKVLEDESAETLDKQLTLYHERALPDLADNIKCGNSLIGPDFFEGRQLDAFDEEEFFRINAFDWKTEFPDITRVGGFDAVISNPPYVFGEFQAPCTKTYFRERYSLARDQFDTYALFVEQGLRLMGGAGRYSMILPDALLARDTPSECRAMLLREGLERVYHCGMVFKAEVSCAVVVVGRGSDAKFIASDVRMDGAVVREHRCRRNRFLKDPGFRFLVHATDREAAVLARLNKRARPLKDFVRISRGEEIGKKDVKSCGTPILVGEDIGRYRLARPTRFIEAAEKDMSLYAPPKIVVVKTGASIVASLDEEGLVTMQSVYSARLRDRSVDFRFLLAILNSALMRFYVRKTFTDYKLLFPQLNQTTLESVPIAVIDSSRREDEQARRGLISLVQRMLDLNKRLAKARTEHEKTILTRQIAATDDRIDRLVYELYELTEAEIQIVEGEVVRKKSKSRSDRVAEDVLEYQNAPDTAIVEGLEAE